jgi:sortase A
VGAADSPPTERVAGTAGTGSKARRALSVLGELLITLGVVLALFLAYQLFWTNVSADGLADEARAQVQESWTTRPANVPPVQAPPPAQGEAFALAYVPRLRDSIWATPVVQGVTFQDLARGLGHYPSTAMPGEVGNFALAGHRATNGEPLRDVDRLQAGDLLVVETADQWFTYRLDRDQIVLPSDVWVLDPVPGDPGATPTQAVVTLTTCHPRWGSEQRWVWWGTLVEATGKDGPPPAAVTEPT